MGYNTGSGSAGAGGGEALGSALGYLFSQGDRSRAMDALRNLQESADQMAPEDSRLKKQQMAALEEMYRIAMAGGMDPQSRAALLQAQNQTAAAERGARGAIVQNAQARGVGGSGVEFGASLANQQGAATRGSLAGTNAAGDARMRALQAMSGSQQGYGQVRGQDLDVERARKQVEMFNAAQRLKKAGMLSGAYSDRADQTQGMFAGVGKGAGALAGFL